MIVDFDVISEESRIWIYQSNRTLSVIEINEIESKIKDFFKPNDYKKTNDMINLSVDTLSVVHSAKISSHKKGKQVKINYAK